MGVQRTCLCMGILMSVALHAAPETPVPILTWSDTLVGAACIATVVGVAVLFVSSYGSGMDREYERKRKEKERLEQEEEARVQRAAEEQRRRIEEALFSGLTRGQMSEPQKQFLQVVQDLAERTLRCEAKISQMQAEKKQL